jgi:hypothetical protein
LQEKGTEDSGRRFDRILHERCFIKECSRNGIVAHGGSLLDDWNPETKWVKVK